MADLIKKISVGGVEKQIDYNSLANLPTNIQTTLSDTDGGYGQRVKAIEDALAAAIDFEAESY